MSEDEGQWSAWMRQALAGDEAAYRRFLAAVTPKLRAIARGGLSRAGRSSAEAEDIVQETLLAIHLKRSTWITTEPIGPWVKAIARYKLIDTLRRRGATGEVDIDAIAEALPAPSDEPAIATRDVMKLAERLPAGQRRVIEAMFVDGHDTAGTAQRLAMSEGAVRVSLHRALGALAGMMRGSM